MKSHMDFEMGSQDGTDEEETGTTGSPLKASFDASSLESPIRRRRNEASVKQSPTLKTLPQSPTDSGRRDRLEPSPSPPFVVARALLDHEPAK